MNRQPPDSITAKVRRIFGRGMLEGVRAAGIPNPEEFLMSQKTLRGAVAGLNGVATKVLAAVPLAEEWTIAQIGAELHRQGFTYQLDVVEGSLAKLLEIGAVKVHGLGKGRTFRSLYSMVQHADEPLLSDQKVAAPMIGRMQVPGTIDGLPPRPVPNKLAAEMPLAIDDPLGFLASLASDARVLGGALNTLADRLDEAALAVVAKIDAAGSAEQKLQQLRQQFKALIGEDA